MNFIRRRPFLFGTLLAFLGFPIVFFILIYSPSLEGFLARNKSWWPMLVYTATVFPWLPYRLRPRRGVVAYWGLATAIFAINTGLLAMLIEHGRAFSPLEYSVYGPFDLVILAAVLYYCAPLFNKTHKQGPPEQE